MDLFFPKDFYQIVSKDPQDIKTPSDGLVDELFSTWYMLTRQAQQGCPECVGVLVRLDQEVIAKPGFLWDRRCDPGAEGAVEDLPDEEQLLVGELGRGDYADSRTVLYLVYS